MSRNSTSTRAKTSTQRTKVTQQAAQSEETSFDIIKPESWVIGDLNCGRAKDNKSGQGKSAPFTLNKRRFFIKVPKMRCPFGAGKPPVKQGEAEKPNPSWSLQMEFGDDKECQIFQEKAREMDQFMIDEATKLENNNNWLGSAKTKPFSREVVESKYAPMVKSAR